MRNRRPALSLAVVLAAVIFFGALPAAGVAGSSGSRMIYSEISVNPTSDCAGVGNGYESDLVEADYPSLTNRTVLLQSCGDIDHLRLNVSRTKLLYQNGFGDSFIYDLQSGQRTLLQPSLGGDPQCASPVWSPDGSQAACMRAGGEFFFFTFDASSGALIQSIDAGDAGSVPGLPPGIVGASLQKFFWIPGAFIAEFVDQDPSAVCGPSGPSPVGFWKFDLASGSWSQLVPPNCDGITDNDVALSPSGTRFAYIEDSEGSDGHLAQSIHITNVDGSGDYVVPVSLAGNPGCGDNVTRLAWTQDERSLLATIESNDPNDPIACDNGIGTVHIDRITIATGARTQIVDDTTLGFQAVDATTTVDDATPPIVQCAPPPTGWQAANVMISCTASDAGSGLANPGDSSFALSTSVATGTETSNASTGSHSVCDDAGNCVTAGPYTGLEVDLKPPAITCNPQTFILNQAGASVTATATDGGSGPASATVSTPVSTPAVGSFSVSVSASDVVGNTATASCPYNVVYDATGFLGGDIKAPPTVNTGHGGRTYPLQWSLTDASGAYVTSLQAIDSVTYKPTSCSAFSSDPSDGLQTTTSGNAGLRYDAASNEYVYNWKTPGAGCYTLFVNLASGQNLSAFFQLS